MITSGYGTFYYRDGHIYEGYWKDDQRWGKGKMTYSVGSVVEESYDGDWEADQKHGVGVYRFRADEGTIYEGQWVWNTRYSLVNILCLS